MSEEEIEKAKEGLKYIQDRLIFELIDDEFNLKRIDCIENILDYIHQLETQVKELEEENYIQKCIINEKGENNARDKV